MAGKKDKKSLASRPLGGGGKLPSKTSINLMIEEKNTGKHLGQIFIFLVFLAGVAVFVKFMVIDRMAMIDRMASNYNSQVRLLEELRSQNEAVGDLEAAYNRFSNNFMTTAELDLQDRMDILKVIEDELLNQDALQSISIRDNVAELTINSAKLDNVSEIVASLEDYDNVEYVTVKKSASDEIEKSGYFYSINYDAFRGDGTQGAMGAQAGRGVGQWIATLLMGNLVNPMEQRIQRQMDAEEAARQQQESQTDNTLAGLFSETQQTEEGFPDYISYEDVGDGSDPEAVVIGGAANSSDEISDEEMQALLEEMQRENTPPVEEIQTEAVEEQETEPEVTAQDVARSRAAAIGQSVTDLSEMIGLTLGNAMSSLRIGIPTLSEVMIKEKIVTTTMTIYFKTATRLASEREADPAKEEPETEAVTETATESTGKEEA